MLIVHTKYVIIHKFNQEMNEWRPLASFPLGTPIEFSTSGNMSRLVKPWFPLAQIPDVVKYFGYILVAQVPLSGESICKFSYVSVFLLVITFTFSLFSLGPDLIRIGASGVRSVWKEIGNLFSFDFVPSAAPWQLKVNSGDTSEDFALLPIRAQVSFCLTCFRSLVK